MNIEDIERWNIKYRDLVVPTDEVLKISLKGILDIC